jgi:hypothetical protein
MVQKIALGKRAVPAQADLRPTRCFHLSPWLFRRPKADRDLMTASRTPGCSWAIRPRAVWSCAVFSMSYWILRTIAINHAIGCVLRAIGGKLSAVRCPTPYNFVLLSNIARQKGLLKNFVHDLVATN